jgi:hypothetical protein
MDFAPLKRWIAANRFYRRAVQEIDFLTYREVRELGLERADTADKTRA